MINLKEMGLECIRVMSKKLKKDIPPEDYYNALMELHNKYSMKGHDPILTKFQYLNRNSIVITNFEFEVKKPVPKVIVFQWKDDIHPLNFKEAAEMYMRDRERFYDIELPSFVKHNIDKSRDGKRKNRQQKQTEVPF